MPASDGAMSNSACGMTKTMKRFDTTNQILTHSQSIGAMEAKNTSIDMGKTMTIVKMVGKDTLMPKMAITGFKLHTHQSMDILLLLTISTIWLEMKNLDS